MQLSGRCTWSYSWRECPLTSLDLVAKLRLRKVVDHAADIIPEVAFLVLLMVEVSVTHLGVCNLWRREDRENRDAKEVKK